MLIILSSSPFLKAPVSPVLLLQLIFPFISIIEETLKKLVLMVRSIIQLSKSSNATKTTKKHILSTKQYLFFLLALHLLFKLLIFMFQTKNPFPVVDQGIKTVTMAYFNPQAHWKFTKFHTIFANRMLSKNLSYKRCKRPHKQVGDCVLKVYNFPGKA